MTKKSAGLQSPSAHKHERKQRRQDGRRDGSTAVRKQAGRKRSYSEETQARMAWILKKQKEYEAAGLMTATVRQLFYAATVDDVVEKAETGYRKIQRIVLLMRLRELLPYSFISDNTRWVRQPTVWTNAREAIQATAQSYRRNYWNTQQCNVQVWLEKEALASVFMQVTEGYHVPLYVTRGFASETYLHESLECATATTKIFYYGDFDPSGVSISDKIERETEKRGLDFERVAVLPSQVDQWKLPSRPNKVRDTRTPKFEKRFPGRQSVELDAIPPVNLQKLITQCIESCIDDNLWKAAKEKEKEDRLYMTTAARRFYDKTGGGQSW